jgi:aurora kinase, other
VPTHVETPKLHLDMFEVGKLLGRGGFGNVVLAREKKSKHRVALKAIPKYNKDHEKVNNRSLHREVAIQCELQKGHPNILRLFNYFYDDTNFYLILEFCIGGSLHKAIHGSDPFNKARSVHILLQLANVLDFCHSKGVLHRDVKPENILLVGNDTIRLADFGVACYKHVPKGRFSGSMGGTLQYLAPELIEENPYDETVDTWAVGVILFEMLEGQRPFGEDEEEMEERIIKGYYFCSQDCIENGAEDLIEMFLQYDPAKRIALREVPNQPWIRNGLQALTNHSNGIQETEDLV